MTAEPNQPLETIYINNLNDKVSLSKLKTSLGSLFQKYGKILQITAHKNLKMKGQAFITYESKESSVKAMELQDHILFSKPIHIAYAKGNSDALYELHNETDKIEQRKQEKEKVNRKRKLTPVTNKQKKKTKLEDWKSLPPNKLLLIQNLNVDDSTKLTEYFEQFQGFLNVRLVKVRNLAFIEFDNVENSTKCLEVARNEELQGKFGSEIILSFAKK
ncbi:U1 small nuclear ribonucleoprotein [Spathaspora sp. JA1]|nr:U1 small nuclear ribonucleoprotein [Spathaspora sp. JA1]